jgi:hypothetical protein
MSEKRAKAIRKAVYGDLSQRQSRKYMMVRNQRDSATGDRIQGTIFNDPASPRARYQRAKRLARGK